eukprot:scaffold2702_cov116-Isochrysis_galbana.AAC.6
METSAVASAVNEQAKAPVERDPEEVHDDAAVGVGQVLGAQGADEREVAADARLEGEEGRDDGRQRAAARQGGCGHGGGGERKQGGHHVLGRESAYGGAEGGGADHAGHHEAGEDLAVRHGVAQRRLERRRPLQHEDVHGALEERLHRAHQRHPAVRRNRTERLHNDVARACSRGFGRRAHRVQILLRRGRRRAALVLAPGEGGHGRARHEEEDGELERRRWAAGGGGEPGELAGGDGNERVAEIGQRESLRQQGGREAGALVLRNQPGFGRREEQGGA